MKHFSDIAYAASIITLVEMAGYWFLTHTHLINP